MSCFKAVGCLNDNLFKAVGCLNDNLFKAVGNVVCNLEAIRFLRVTPEVMWLTEANNFTGVFDVTSNVDWVVVGDIAADDAIITYLHNADEISNATMVSNIAISEYTHISNQLEFSNEVLIRNGEITIMTMFGNRDEDVK